MEPQLWENKTHRPKPKETRVRRIGEVSVGLNKKIAQDEFSPLSAVCGGHVFARLSLGD